MKSTLEWVGEGFRINPPHPSAPPPFTSPPHPCPAGSHWNSVTQACEPIGFRANPPGPSAPGPSLHAQPSSPPRATPETVSPAQRAAPPRPVPHSAPPPFPCPAGTSWNGSECAPMRYLGLSIPPGVQQAHAKAILVAWNTQHHALADYGLTDVANPAWAERDGIVLHAFAQWWSGTPALNPNADQADANGVVVAQLTDAHVSALDNWFAQQGQQALPGVPVVDAAASKELLILWSKTDGAGQAGALADYGLNPGDVTPVWTTRDATELQLFQTWWNAQGNTAVATSGALDIPTSNALKKWFVGRLSSIPSGWVAPPAQPSAGACPAGQVWDDTNKVCQPAPAAASAEPPAKSNAMWWVLGGLAVVAGSAVLLSSRAVGGKMAPVRDNPGGYYVRVRGGNRETYGPYPTLQRAKTFARIGAQKGAHDRVVVRGGRIVRHYRAGTGESLVHENPTGQKAIAAIWRVQLNSQGYDSRGRYFGRGQPLYEYVAQDARGRYIATDEIRATNRNHAKDLVRRRLSTYDVKFTR